MLSSGYTRFVDFKPFFRKILTFLGLRFLTFSHFFLLFLTFSHFFLHFLILDLTSIVTKKEPVKALVKIMYHSIVCTGYS